MEVDGNYTVLRAIKCSPTSFTEDLILSVHALSKNNVFRNRFGVICLADLIYIA